MVLINRLMKDLQKPAGVYQGGQVRFGSLLKSVFTLLLIAVLTIGRFAYNGIKNELSKSKLKDSEK